MTTVKCPPRPTKPRYLTYPQSLVLLPRRRLLRPLRYLPRYLPRLQCRRQQHLQQYPRLQICTPRHMAGVTKCNRTLKSKARGKRGSRVPLQGDVVGLVVGVIRKRLDAKSGWRIVEMSRGIKAASIQKRRNEKLQKIPAALCSSQRCAST